MLLLFLAMTAQAQDETTEQTGDETTEETGDETTEQTGDATTTPTAPAPAATTAPAAAATTAPPTTTAPATTPAPAATATPAPAAAATTAPVEDTTTEEPGIATTAPVDDTPTAPKPEWAYAPFVNPILDFTIYDPGGFQGAYTIVNLGLEGGLMYYMKGDQIPTWAGYTRVSGYYGFGGEGVQSWELRVGSFMGPVFKILSLESGLDLFGNQLTVDGDGQVASAGIDVPLLARLDFKIPSVWGGIGTAYLFDKERRVDWQEQDQFGFGHEFQYVVGAGIKAGIRVSVEYTHRIVVTGDEETIMLGAGI